MLIIAQVISIICDYVMIWYMKWKSWVISKWTYKRITWLNLGYSNLLEVMPWVREDKQVQASWRERKIQGESGEQR